MTERVSMDAARRAAINARCKNATPGQWVFQDYRGSGGFIRAGQEALAQMWNCRDEEDYTNATANGAFIAHARADVPDLLAALTAAEAENARLREALERSAIQRDWFGNRALYVCGICHDVAGEKALVKHADDCPLARAALGEAAPAREE